MAFSPKWFRVLWIGPVTVAVYAVLIALLTNGTIQRHAMYLHKIHKTWFSDLNVPEQVGFLYNQVRPLYIPTTDGENLYAWHILPLSLYAQHEDALVREGRGPSANVTDTLAFKLMAEDPESRLVIAFHGNAGTIGDGFRAQSVRNMASSATRHVHVLTLDYRGFGYSSGSPTEQGLITDGLSAVEWAIGVVGIPPERIVLMGHSLGTAVASAVAEHYVVEQGVEFASVILVSAFPDTQTVIRSYKIASIIPILGPLEFYPPLQYWLGKYIKDHWPTGARLTNWIRKSRNPNLFLLHAFDDTDVPWYNTEELFYVVANATTEEGMTVDQIKAARTTIAKSDFEFTHVWTAGVQGQSGVKRITEEIISFGGHDDILKYPVLAKAVLKSFGV